MELPRRKHTKSQNTAKIWNHPEVCYVSIIITEGTGPILAYRSGAWALGKIVKPESKRQKYGLWDFEGFVHSGTADGRRK